MNNVSYNPKQKVTLPFAHEFEKSYETLVPLVPSWSRTFKRDKHLGFASTLISYSCLPTITKD